MITIFEKKKLSPGTMTDYIQIQEETLSGTKIGSLNSNVTFTNVWSGMVKLEVIKPTFRFEGVAIPTGTTHIAYMSYNDTVYKLEGNSFFVRKPGKKTGFSDRRFKLLSKTNFGEQDEYLLLYLIETGLSSVTGSQL